jgi:RNA polymerase sigma-70 factor, ECF subfamily
MTSGADCPASDEQLVQRYREGSGEAFRQLVERYETPLFGYLKRALGSRSDAEDAFQDVFLKVYKALGRFDTTRRFRPWLYTIAANHTKNVYRARSKGRPLSLDQATGPDAGGKGNLHQLLPSGERGPFEQTEALERAGLIRRAVAALPPKGREALSLFYFDGFSYDDIARCVGVPLGTVKSRIHNATQSLLKSLERQRDSQKSHERSRS